ncbi:carboxypeptidase-like regulatory domain-containing protein [Sphingobacterium sp. E70]|uniref:carboxypeptidase-like regulatory domain-containing protein n=1 Tax=Sphingobacterium sp. E70 TaxID=2853439 RepID=UPI00359C2131
MKGKVVDSKTQEPLASVSILAGGVAKGTTDRTGHFEIEVETGALVRFQLIGYEGRPRPLQQHSQMLKSH